MSMDTLLALSGLYIASNADRASAFSLRNLGDLFRIVDRLIAVNLFSRFSLLRIFAINAYLDSDKSRVVRSAARITILAISASSPLYPWSPKNVNLGQFSIAKFSTAMTSRKSGFHTQFGMFNEMVPDLMMSFITELDNSLFCMVMDSQNFLFRVTSHALTHSL